MTIRMTQISDGARTIVQIDGRLQAQDTSEVTRGIRAVRGPWILNVANLLSADADGVQLLLDLRSTGVPIHGVSPYLELLLNS